MDNDILTNSNFAKSLAGDLISLLRIEKPPVNLNLVIKAQPRKILVLGQDLGNDDGFSVGLNQIIYNNKQSVVRKRFTVAHELGHILLGHNSGYRIVDFKTKDPNEKLANIFAAELLVPLSLLEKEFLATESLSSIAKKYNVSNEMMMWRLNQTGLDIKLENWE
jgi:Zn-dependent peptidase ImmA (M78 family)